MGGGPERGEYGGESGGRLSANSFSTRIYQPTEIAITEDTGGAGSKTNKRQRAVLVRKDLIDLNRQVLEIYTAKEVEIVLLVQPGKLRKHRRVMLWKHKRARFGNWQTLRLKQFIRIWLGV